MIVVRTGIVPAKRVVVAGIIQRETDGVVRCSVPDESVVAGMEQINAIPVVRSIVAAQGIAVAGIRQIDAIDKLPDIRILYRDAVSS